MAITYIELRTAMETYDVKLRIIPAPASYYLPGNLRIKLNSSDRILFYGNKTVHKEITDKVVEELKEENTGEDITSYDKFHSVKGLFTLLLILDKKYSKERRDKLINDTYKKLLEVPVIKQMKIPFKKEPFKKQNIQQKWNDFYNLVCEYDDIINPFNFNNENELKNPSEYLDKIELSVEHSYDNDFIDMKLSTQKFYMNFEAHNDFDWIYCSKIWNDDNSDYVWLAHQRCSGIQRCTYFNDEVIEYTDYTVADDIKGLEISMVTGMALEYGKVAPVTEKQLDKMMFYLKNNIDMAKRIIIKEIKK